MGLRLRAQVKEKTALASAATLQRSFQLIGNLNHRRSPTAMQKHKMERQTLLKAEPPWAYSIPAL